MLIFVQSKERAQELFHELVYDGINVDVIHAERTKAQRDSVVKNFRLGECQLGPWMCVLFGCYGLWCGGGQAHTYRCVFVGALHVSACWSANRNVMVIAVR